MLNFCDEQTTLCVYKYTKSESKFLGLLKCYIYTDDVYNMLHSYYMIEE